MKFWELGHGSRSPMSWRQVCDVQWENSMVFFLLFPNSPNSSEWVGEEQICICKAQVKSVFRIGGGVAFWVSSLAFDLRLQSEFSYFISSWLFISVESRFNPAEIIRAGRPIVHLSASVNFQSWHVNAGMRKRTLTAAKSTTTQPWRSKRGNQHVGNM